MRKTRFLVPALIALALAWRAAPPPVGAGAIPEIRWDVREQVLSNGLKVLLLRDSRAPVITFMVWYRVGARNEAPGMTGLAHLVEHMMFKGTKRFGPKVFSNLIQRNGGRHNAFTSQDYTAYFERMAADRVEVAMELEGDRMKNLLFEPKEFLLERAVVQEERRRSVDDSPVSLLWETLRAAAFQSHPYGWPIVGWAPDLQRLRVEEARRFYETYYAANNATLVAAGDFDPEALLAKVRKHFGRIPPEKKPPAVPSREPPQRGERRVRVKKEARLPYLAAAYHVPTYAHPDAYALDVLGEVLGGGKSSRLQRVLLRERQLVLSVGASYPGISIDPGLFTVSAQPAPGVEVERVEAALWEEVERVKREEVPEAELARVKRRISAQYVIGLDSQFYRAMSLGRAEIAGSWKLVTEYLPRIAAVTAGDLRRVARKYLVEDNRTVGILVPLPSEGESPPRRAPTGRAGGHIR